MYLFGRASSVIRRVKLLICRLKLNRRGGRLYFRGSFVLLPDKYSSFKISL